MVSFGRQLVIRHVKEGYELVELKGETELVLACFRSCEDALQRWVEVENRSRVEARA